MLLPVLGHIWERNVDELMPYCLQVLGLMLDMTPTPALGVYAGLLPRALAEDLWRSPGNVAGIVRLLRAYFGKHAIFSDVLSSNMQTIFERFHFALGHKSLGVFAFSLLNAILKLLPPAMYQQYFQTALALIFQRLQGRRSPDLERECLVSLSLFAHMQEDPAALPRVLAQIQPDLFLTFFEKIWLASVTKVMLLSRRKVCLVGLAKLMTYPEIHRNPPLLFACCKQLAELLKWRSAGLLCWLEIMIPSMVSKRPEEGEEYEPKFSRLHHVELGTAKQVSGIWDLMPEIQEKAQVLVVVRALLTPIRGAIAALPDVPPALGEIWQ